MLDLVNILLTLLGIGFLIVGIVLCYAIQRRFRGEGHPSYAVVVILIALFVAGYAGFLIHLFATYGAHQPADTLVSAIFFFGSVFVIVTTVINGQFIEKLTEKTVNMEGLNSQYKQLNDQLGVKTLALQKSEEELKKKNDELEKTLEDFYTMRIGMLNQMEKGTVEEENRTIRARIDALKQ